MQRHGKASILTPACRYFEARDHPQLCSVLTAQGINRPPGHPDFGVLAVSIFGASPKQIARPAVFQLNAALLTTLYFKEMRGV
ncbi:MAG: hypothetical protein OEQ74_01890 [Gammaproteobacteria bacterium]|nr:hypothetical protein [Gammaproteobacteria bacterium]